jgi:hypothetical protein
MSAVHVHSFKLVLAALILAGCGGAAPPAMSPRQFCEKQMPMAEAWRVAEGQDPTPADRVGPNLENCVKRWTTQQQEDPKRFAKIAACAVPKTNYDALEQCIIDNLPK